MPFTPNGKENVVYLAAEADQGEPGQLTLSSFDRDRTTLGPTQVNARVLATPEISGQLALLNRPGSQVILGNLLIVPVEEWLLYVKPIFVQGSATNRPALQKVAVFYNDKVGYAANLATPSARSSAASNPPSPHPKTAAPSHPRPPAAATTPSRASSPRPTRNTRPPSAPSPPATWRVPDPHRRDGQAAPAALAAEDGAPPTTQRLAFAVALCYFAAAPRVEQSGSSLGS